MPYPAVLGYTENEVYLDKLAITLSSHLEHPHHSVAVVFRTEGMEVMKGAKAFPC
jgi:hypothetical protein